MVFLYNKVMQDFSYQQWHQQLGSRRPQLGKPPTRRPELPKDTPVCSACDRGGCPLPCRVCSNTGVIVIATFVLTRWPHFTSIHTGYALFLYVDPYCLRKITIESPCASHRFVAATQRIIIKDSVRMVEKSVVFQVSLGLRDFVTTPNMNEQSNCSGRQ